MTVDKMTMYKNYLDMISVAKLVNAFYNNDVFLVLMVLNKLNKNTLFTSFKIRKLLK